MPFHGYGQSDTGHDERSDGQNHLTERYRRYQEPTQVNGHSNDGPVDLSKFGTATGRGTWGFGRKKLEVTNIPIITGLEQNTHSKLKSKSVDVSENHGERGGESCQARLLSQVKGGLPTLQGTQETGGNVLQVTPIPAIFGGSGDGGSGVQGLDGARETINDNKCKELVLREGDGSTMQGAAS